MLHVINSATPIDVNSECIYTLTLPWISIDLNLVIKQTYKRYLSPALTSFDCKNLIVMFM